jgi:hypothetical protein
LAEFIALESFALRLGFICVVEKVIDPLFVASALSAEGMTDAVADSDGYSISDCDED